MIIIIQYTFSINHPSKLIIIEVVVSALKFYLQLIKKIFPSKIIASVREPFKCRCTYVIISSSVGGVIPVCVCVCVCVCVRACVRVRVCVHNTTGNSH